MRSESPVRSDIFWLMLVLASAVATVIACEDSSTSEESEAARVGNSANQSTVEKSATTPKQPSVGSKKKKPEKKSENEKKSEKKSPPKSVFKGTVVLAGAALKKRGIQVAKEMENQAVLETPAGELIPIAADWRGRAFYQDKRLRGRKVELVGYRRKGIPYLQVLTVFMFNAKGQREEMDYWCDICSIPMYEIKDCECCQGPILLRFRPGKLPDFLKKKTDGIKQSTVKSPTP